MDGNAQCGRGGRMVDSANVGGHKRMANAGIRVDEENGFQANTHTFSHSRVERPVEGGSRMCTAAASETPDSVEKLKVENGDVMGEP
eukprot:3409373-Karenia_brevis.AAC.1